MRPSPLAASVVLSILALTPACSGPQTRAEVELEDTRRAERDIYEEAMQAYRDDRGGPAADALIQLLDACPTEDDCAMRDEAVTLFAMIVAEPPWMGEEAPGNHGLQRFDAIADRQASWAPEVLDEAARWMAQNGDHEHAAPAMEVVLELEPCSEKRDDRVEFWAVALELSGDIDRADATREGEGVPSCPDTTP